MEKVIYTFLKDIGHEDRTDILVAMLKSMPKDDYERGVRDERQRIIREIEELSWCKNDIGVEEIEPDTWYIKVDDLKKLGL